jgi:hypothetical protein
VLKAALRDAVVVPCSSSDVQAAIEAVREALASLGIQEEALQRLTAQLRTRRE